MFPASRHRATFQEYLEIEEISQVKHEYLDGEIVAMAGGTPEHAALSAAVLVRIGSALRGKAYSGDLRLRIPTTGLATYADATVVCGELERDPESPTHITNPTVVFEVLSPSSEEYDRGDKRQHYQRLESLKAYVLVAQDRRRVELFARQPDGSWSHGVHGPGQRLELAAIGCTLDVDELYASAGVGVA